VAAAPRSPQFAGTPAAELFRRQQSRDPHARRARQWRITSRRAALTPRMMVIARRGVPTAKKPFDFSQKKYQRNY